jgi:hypothetical protein
VIIYRHRKEKQQPKTLEEENTMTELRETYERAAKLIGANLNESTVCGKGLDNDYFISVSEHQKNVHILLVRDMHTGRGFENIAIAEFVIKVGASDKVIMNRYNKLFATYNNR